LGRASLAHGLQQLTAQDRGHVLSVHAVPVVVDVDPLRALNFPGGRYPLPAPASSGICQHFIPDSQGRQVPDAWAGQVLAGAGDRRTPAAPDPPPVVSRGLPGLCKSLIPPVVDGGDVLGGHAVQVQVDLGRPLDRPPLRLWERLGGPHHARGYGNGAGRGWPLVAPSPYEQGHQAGDPNADNYHGDHEQNMHQIGHGRHDRPGDGDGAEHDQDGYRVEPTAVPVGGAPSGMPITVLLLPVPAALPRRGFGGGHLAGRVAGHRACCQPGTRVLWVV
jgi:hypothetical protein